MTGPEIHAENLWEQWRALAPDSPEEVSRLVFEDLVKRYSKPFRKYHNLYHIQVLLDLIRQNEPALKEANTLRFAAWFHDAVYDPYRTNNEAKSAELALRVMKAMQIPEAVAALTADLITRTATHDGKGSNSDTLFFLDADLAILGAPPADYQAYTEAIREEYQFVPELQYRQGRRKVLLNFLEREIIYYTPRMRFSFELKARENMERELGRL
ncbi:MAG: metal-dependent phosphohydrolase [Bacteroidia bacterium]|nr:metal-dependent phosphohydrolase [Bacteroidia bacterium]